MFFIVQVILTLILQATSIEKEIFHRWLYFDP